MRAEGLPISFFPVLESRHIHGPVGVIDLVKDAVIPDAQTPGKAGALQFQGLGRTRVIGQSQDALPDIVADETRNARQVFFQGRLELEFIGCHASLGGTRIHHEKWTAPCAARRKFSDRPNLPTAAHNHQRQEGPQCGSPWGPPRTEEGALS